ncbi:MAG TPA: hypothetical protein DF699_15020 [Phycisphaerales bacterium]|nr:hypothetical protein [Phycisphaerales bacterium]
MSLAVRAKGFFNEQAVRDLEKAHQPQSLHPITDALPSHVAEIFRKKNEVIAQQEQARVDNGIYCVPFGHIMYHCLRCEFLHGPGSSGIIDFHEHNTIDNTDYKLKLPIHILYGYTLLTLASPVFKGETHSFNLHIEWPHLGANTKLDWLWGKRGTLINLARMDRDAKHSARTDHL